MPSELGFTSLSVLILSIYCVTTRHWGNQSGCYSRHYDLLVFCMGKKKPPKQQLLWSVIKTVPGWDDGMGELDLVENQQVAPSVQPPLRCCKGLAAPTTFSAANTLRFRLWSPIQGTPSPPLPDQGHTLPPTGKPRSHPSSDRQATTAFYFKFLSTLHRWLALSGLHLSWISPSSQFCLCPLLCLGVDSSTTPW